MFALQRKPKNKITMLQDDNGQQIYEESDLLIPYGEIL